MQKSDDQRSTLARRGRASWQMRACSVGLCIGAQVFLVGAGAVMPVCLNASWIAALCAPVMAVLTVWVCRRALVSPCAGQGWFSRVLHAMLGVSFLLNAVFVVASLISLAEQSLLPQTRATHSLLFTIAAVFFCALSGGAGASRLSFALRIGLPLLLAILCAASLPLDVTVGLFPLLGAGGAALLAGCICMLGAAFPALLMMYPPQELDRLCDTAKEIPVPSAWFFVWRAALSAAAGAALLFALTLGSTYESIAGSRAWGERLLIISSGRPREGLAQTGLTIAQMIAVLLLAVHMLLGAQQALERCWPRLKKRRLSLPLCAAAMAAALCALLFIGFDTALVIAPCLLLPLLLAIIFHQKLGGSHGT